MPGAINEPQPSTQEPQTLRTVLSRRQLVMVMVGVMLAMLLSALDQTIVGTAMPRVIAELNGLEHYAWTFTSYMLASTVMVPIYGKLSDIYGRRPFFLAGMVLFLAGSALSGTSQSMTQLILYRSLQGLGAGAMMPIVQAIVGDVFPPAERGKWQGMMVAVFGFASIVGPVAGGWITDNWGWRWVFYVNMPVGALALVTAGLTIPSQGYRRQHQIDYLGAAVLVAAAVPMLLAFSWAGTQYDWGSPQIVGLLAFSAVAFIAFFLVESHVAEPIISPRLFRNSIFSVSVIASFLTSVGMFGTIMYLPLFMQGVIGDTATNSGAVLTPMMLGFMASSVIGGQILSRTGRYKVLALVSFAIASAGMFLLSRMDANATNGLVVRNMIVTGLGMGTMMGLFTIVVQNAFPFSQLGQVTASLQFFRSVGGTIGVAILGTIVTNGFQSSFQSNLPEALKRMLPPAQLAALENPQTLLAPEATASLQQGFAAFGPQGNELFAQLLQTIRVSLASAIASVFTVSTGVMLLAMLTCLFLREIPLRRSHSEKAIPSVADNHWNAPTRTLARAHAPRARRVVAVSLLAAMAIGVVALVLITTLGVVVAQVEWRSGDTPRATVQWGGNGDANGGATVSGDTGSPGEQPSSISPESSRKSSTWGTPIPRPTPTVPSGSLAVTPTPSEQTGTNGERSVGEVEGTESPSPANPGGVTQDRLYVVQPGDTLSSIAARAYGDPNAWQRIVAANRDKISNPNLIVPGQELLVPGWMN